MNKNVGTTDSYIRFMVGLAILLNIVILEPGVVGTIIMLAIGLMMIFTYYTDYCFVYDLLKVCTCDEECTHCSDEGGADA